MSNPVGVGEDWTCVLVISLLVITFLLDTHTRHLKSQRETSMLFAFQDGFFDCGRQMQASTEQIADLTGLLLDCWHRLGPDSG